MRAAPADVPASPTERAMRFSREQHLRRAKDFASLRNAAFRRDCGVFIASAQLNPQPAVPAVPRLGVIASRRVGNAVARNRAKRRLRAVFRLGQNTLPADCDLVLVARKSTLTADFALLSARFAALAAALHTVLNRSRPS